MQVYVKPTSYDNVSKSFVPVYMSVTTIQTKYSEANKIYIEHTGHKCSQRLLLRYRMFFIFVIKKVGLSFVSLWAFYEAFTIVSPILILFSDELNGSSTTWLCPAQFCLTSQICGYRKLEWSNVCITVFPGTELMPLPCSPYFVGEQERNCLQYFVGSISPFFTLFSLYCVLADFRCVVGNTFRAQG